MTKKNVAKAFNKQNTATNNWHGDLFDCLKTKYYLKKPPKDNIENLV